MKPYIIKDLIQTALKNSDLELENNLLETQISSINLVIFLTELEELIYPITQKSLLEIGLYSNKKPLLDLNSLEQFLFDKIN